MLPYQAHCHTQGRARRESTDDLNFGFGQHPQLDAAAFLRHDAENGGGGILYRHGRTDVLVRTFSASNASTSSTL
jgi:hypothetical protein